MAHTTTSAVALANPALNCESGSHRTPSPGKLLFGNIIRIIWPDKPVQNFVAVAGTSERHAERVLADERGLALDTFLAIADTPEGGQFLLQVLKARCSRQPWFRDFKRALVNADLDRQERELAELRRRVNALG